MTLNANVVSVLNTFSIVGISNFLISAFLYSPFYIIGAFVCLAYILLFIFKVIKVDTTTGGWEDLVSVVASLAFSMVGLTSFGIALGIFVNKWYFIQLILPAIALISLLVNKFFVKKT